MIKCIMLSNYYRCLHMGCVRLIYHVNYIKCPKIGVNIIIGEYFWNLRIHEDDM